MAKKTTDSVAKDTEPTSDSAGGSIYTAADDAGFDIKTTADNALSMAQQAVEKSKGDGGDDGLGDSGEEAAEGY